jgi:2-polyprenyl-3-methyl-5-hydroxy-6-metoxy-1,4-benzoquinol methylase
MVDASTLERGLKVTSCPAGCENELYYTEEVTDRYGFVWTLAKCPICALEWQLQPLTTEARKQFYGSGLYRQLCEQVTGKPWTDPKYLREAQAEYAEQWFSDRGLKFHLPVGRWLDFGGSTGVVSAKWAHETIHPWRPQPIDVTVADYGDGATVTPEEALKQGPYDAVLCCQTLDHLPNPLEMLRTFREVTRDGGVLFVDVVKNARKKVDHDWYAPNATCFLGMVERAGWVVDWLDATTNPTHWTIGAHK